MNEFLRDDDLFKWRQKGINFYKITIFLNGDKSE